MDFIFNFIANTNQLVGRLNAARQAFVTFNTATKESLRGLVANANNQISRLVSEYESLRNIQATLKLESAYLIRLQDEVRAGGAASAAAGAQLMQMFGSATIADALTAATDRVSELKLEIAQNNREIRQGVGDSKVYRQEVKATEKVIRVLSNAVSAYENLLRTRLQTTLQNAANGINLIRTSAGALARVFTVVSVAAAAFILSFVPIAQAGMEFEQSLSRIVSVNTEMIAGTEEAAQAIARVETVILDLGASTNFTASEVAEAGKVLAQAGLSANEIMAALPATLNLANAGFLELGEAASVAADFMNAFGLAGWEISRVADVMAKAQAVSNTNIEQLTHAFSFASATAAAFGQRIEDIATGLAALANSGIKASRAGTGISQILSALAKDAEKTDVLMRRLGSSFDAVNPSAVGFVDIVKEFQRVGIRAGDAFEFFGVRAGRTMLALQNVSTETLDQLQDDIDNAFGTSIDQAINNWDNLAGSVKQFQSIIERLQITFHKTFQGTLRTGIDAVTGVLRNLNAWMETSPFAPLVTGVALAGVVISALVVTVGTLLTPLLLVAASIAGVATNMIGLQISSMAATAALESATLAHINSAGALRKESNELKTSIILRRQHIAALEAQMAANIGNQAVLDAFEAQRDAERFKLATDERARAGLVRGRLQYREGMRRLDAAGTAGGLGGGILSRAANAGQRVRGAGTAVLEYAKAKGPTGALVDLFKRLGVAVLAVGPLLTNLFGMIPSWTVITAGLGAAWAALVTAWSVSTVIILPLVAAIGALTAGFIGMFTSLKSGKDILDTTKNIETLSGILEFLGSVWDRVVFAFMAGFGWISDLVSDASGTFMEWVNLLGTEMWTTILGIVDLLGTMGEAIGVILGLLAGIGAAAIMAGIWLLTKLLQGINLLIKSIIWGLNKIRGWVGLDPITDGFEKLSEAVGKTNDKLKEYNKNMEEARDASDRELSDLQEFAGLTSRVDELNLQEAERLLELMEKYKNIPTAIEEVEKQIEGLEADLDGAKKAGGSEFDLAARTQRIDEARKILESMKQTQAENNFLLRNGNEGLKASVETQRELNEEAETYERRMKALKEAEDDLASLQKEAAGLRKKDINDELALLDEKIAKINEIAKVTRDAAQAEIDQAQDAFTAAKDENDKKTLDITDEYYKNEEDIDFRNEEFEFLQKGLEDAKKLQAADAKAFEEAAREMVGPFDREKADKAKAALDSSSGAVTAYEARLKNSNAELEKLLERRTQLQGESDKLAEERGNIISSAPDSTDAKAKMAEEAAKNAEAIKQVDEKKKELLAEQAKNENAFLRQQSIEKAKIAGDRLKEAELENEAFLEAEQERIDKEFALNEPATQARKAQALKSMKEIADAKLQAVKDDMAEDAKKKADAEKKKKEDEIKKQKTPEDDVRKKAADHLASQVTSTAQLLALNSALDTLEQRREGRARQAVLIYQAQKDKLAALLATQQKAIAEGAGSQTMSNIAAGIEKAQAAVNIAKGIAGKKLTQAGVTEGSMSLADGVVGDTGPAGLSGALSLATPVMATLATALQNFVANLAGVNPNLAPPALGAGLQQALNNSATTPTVNAENTFTFNITGDTDHKKLVATIKQTINESVFGPVG